MKAKLLIIILILILKISKSQNYCIPTFSNSCGGGYISGVFIGNISNNSSCNGNSNNYMNYSINAFTTILDTSATYNIDISCFGSGGIMGWIDYNQDGDFDDADEYILEVAGSNFYSGTITIPNTAIDGITTLRIIKTGGVVGSNNSCGSFIGGETEDYKVTINNVPVNQNSNCFSAPDGVNGNMSGWSYKDYIIPNGYKIDSVYMDANRPGYTIQDFDFVFAYCQGTTTFNSSNVTYPFIYGSVNTSLYNVWIDLTSFNYTSTGMVRVSLPSNAGAVWNNLCFAISPTNATCFSSPQSTDASNWSYVDYIIPTGFKLDSVYMNASRPGYSVQNYDFVLASCQGTTVFTPSLVTYPFNYGSINTSLYNTWINLTSFTYTSVGMVRVSLPTNTGAIWNNLCFAISPITTSCAQNLSSGLVAKYDFSGNANDISGNNHNGTVYGATLTTDRFGNSNKAYDFTNGVDKIIVPNNSALSLTTDFSFNFWINIRSFNGSFNSIISKMESGSCNHYGYFMGMMSWNGENKIEFQADPICSNANAYLPNNNGVLQLNQWYNIGITYNDSESKLKYYKDGVLFDSIIQSLDIQNTAYDLIIGNHLFYPYSLTSTGQNFDGIIDDIRIYNRELTSCEMDSLYSMPNPVATCVVDLNSSLVAQYDFTGNANDASGNGNNGTVNGATLTTDRFGNPNSAYLFDGSTAFIDVPHSTSLSFPSNAISVAFWANIYSVPGSGFNGLILSKQNGSGGTMQGFNVFDNTNLTAGLMVSNGGGNITGVSTPIVLNQYHHYAYVYNNGTGYSYLDGVLTSTVTGQTATIGANTMNLLIGKANWSNINALNFHGVIDEISIYERELSECDIDSLYNVPNPNPVAINSTESKKSNFVIYPNPTHDKIHIITNNSVSKIEIFNALGQSVITELLVSSNQVDVSNLPFGFYFIKISTKGKGENEIIKFVKD